MHPDLEDFLEEAFGGVQPTASAIGRVVVEPDYDAAPDERDRDRLARELNECLHAQPAPTEIPGSGTELPIDSKYAVLKKYLRKISLYPEPVEGSWVEVSPPGNWI
ncbi:MAG TPA: hypothetical protein VH477_08400 [Bryobacteraceae bacterium]|jgi:hypothetical protein